MNTPSRVAPEQAWLELPDGKLHAFTDFCRMGRHADGNDLVLEERAVSAHHAIITSSPRGYTLADQQSTNGTTVNGVPLGKPARIKDGDEIRIGRITSLRFRCLRADPALTSEDLAKTTTVLQDFVERDCLLLLADVAGFSEAIANDGDVAAVKRLQIWIAGMRPLLEGNGAVINRYVGDAIFAFWERTPTTSKKVLAAVRTVESYRMQSPLQFRVVLHQGTVFATVSEFGDELVGQDVNFLFRAEKIAKRFGCHTMLSEAAVCSLELQETCDAIGDAVVEGIEGNHLFFSLPPSLA